MTDANKDSVDPPTCQWAEELETEDGAIYFGPYCGKPATHTACTPILGGKVCEAHKCRCSKRLDTLGTLDRRHPIWGELDRIAEQLVPMGKPLSDALAAWRALGSERQQHVLSRLVSHSADDGADMVAYELLRVART